jgi:hypothetical protein
MGEDEKAPPEVEPLPAIVSELVSLRGVFHERKNLLPERGQDEPRPIAGTAGVPELFQAAGTAAAALLALLFQNREARHFGLFVNH